MPAPNHFSDAQRSHIKNLEKLAKEVSIEGYDLAGRPVVYRRDKRGAAVYAIRRDGSGVAPPASPVLEFTIEDAYLMQSIDYNMLVRLAKSVEEDG